MIPALDPSDSITNMRSTIVGFVSKYVNLYSSRKNLIICYCMCLIVHFDNQPLVCCLIDALFRQICDFAYSNGLLHWQQWW